MDKAIDYKNLKRKYAFTGHVYDFLDAPWEFLRYRKIRPRVWAEAAGARRILDAGIGTGRNISYYPRGVEVHGVDLSETMLQACRQRIRSVASTAGLACGTVTCLPFKNQSFDAVVSTFLFCVLPDELQPPALKELRRVLRPGGKLILLEYVYSQNPIQRLVMQSMSLWVEFLYGARFDRRTPQHLLAGNWRIESERFVSKDIVKLIVARPVEFGLS